MFRLVPQSLSLNRYLHKPASSFHHLLILDDDIYCCFTLDNLLVISKSLYLSPKVTGRSAIGVCKLECVFAASNGKWKIAVF